MKRRRVLELGASAVLTPFLSIDARADDAGSPAPAPVPTIARVVSKIGTNHGHVFEVSVADVKAGVAKTYDLTGSAAHAHAVTLGPDEFKRLAAGEILRTPSTKEGHLHRLLVKIAPAVDPPEAVSVCEVTIGGKDDHELIINAADMTAKVEKTYDIQGIAAHTHQVKLASADFEKLLRGDELALNTTSGDAHTHVVFIRYRKSKG